MYAAATVKEVHCVMTKSVDALRLKPAMLDFLYQTAIDRYVKSEGKECMTTYDPDGINIKIGNGNGEVQTDIICLGLKEPLWCMINDCDDYFVATLLKPSESV